MQLTGIRIPDPIIQSIDSSQALWEHLIRKPQPKKLAQILIEGQERLQKTRKLPLLSSLPNVKIMPSKQVPEMMEAALGRQKVIERELDRYGISVPFKDVVEQIQTHEEMKLREGRYGLSKEEEMKNMEELELPEIEETPQNDAGRAGSVTQPN